ncbi:MULTISPECIES: Rieske 2Fe-2S domain-containing protein [unclassified Sphingobium]|uniref:Rieske 2Fe-2S domain-containing protein n=1 Tax=unclassified Sphingobium TaxID=2611147 RepID=UPI0022242DB2|nr:MULTISPECIES: Rieske 2Fe-2S domain-containing protein [unclassified Sphingobium]MCW2381065.1 nitrite reductase/ring-hydroxylating ferredoxin subunit [Sphingobium sp. B2D3B]MCW2398828.1 nitrite reductase/ring-hydroxylating ferredoxin subunit [Sphingobium sp. B2D3C]
MSPEDNALLTQTGPGTPMGALMREYWIPAFMPDEVKAGGAPLRLRLLGENFLAFRSPDGSLGVVDHRCAHRCASLFYGRNEEGGIRCVYHGWKFDRTGQCIEMPSEPPETDYKDKVKIRALPVVERYGVAWVYMGTRAEPPALPHFDWDEVEAGQPLTVTFMMRECNWLQALEGDIDTCHVGFLHLGAATPDQFEEGSINYYRQMRENLAPKYEALETDYGTMYCAYRPAGDNLYHRIGQFALPFWTMAPSEPLDHIRARAWVPLDDHHAMLVTIGGPRTGATTLTKAGKPIPGTTSPINFLPNTTDWLGRFRIDANPRNDHLISREAQSTQSYSGIEAIPVQDQAVTESMGPVVDRTMEHLGTSDRMIVLTRRRLKWAATALLDDGVVPPGVDNPACYHNVRAGYALLPPEQDWLDFYNARRAVWSRGTAEPVDRKRRLAPAPA